MTMLLRKSKPRKRSRDRLSRDCSELAGHLAALMSLAGVSPAVAGASQVLASAPATADEAFDPDPESACCYLLAAAQNGLLDDERAERYQRVEDYFLERWHRMHPRRRRRMTRMVLAILSAFEARGVKEALRR